MSDYQPRIQDMQFVLSQVLNAPQQLQAMPVFAEVDADLVQQVLALIEDGIGLKQAVAEIAGAAGAGKSELYQSVLEARKALR